MAETDLSRRSFLKSASLAAAAAGALGALGIAGTEKTAYAEEAVTATTETTPEYMALFGEETAYLPVKKAEWTMLSGPIGYESREIAEAEITRTDTCDFLVVGLGISGMIASLEAADKGAKVITAEKMPQGRCLFESAGAYNTRMQQEGAAKEEPTAIVPDPVEYFNAIMRASNWRARPHVIWNFINKSGEAVDFFDEMLRKADKDVYLYPTIQKPAAYGFETIQAEHKIHIPEGKKWTSWWTGPLAWDSLVTTAATYSNLDIRYNTAGVQLTQNEAGRVTGAILKDKNGYYKVEAAKGVLLCTGGYEANPDLMKAWLRPEDYQSACVYAPCAGPTGDGHMMGLKLGAQMDPIPHCPMLFRSGVPGRPSDAVAAAKSLTKAIWVDYKGRRFVNEGVPHNIAANAINTAGISGKPVWFVVDSKLMTADAEGIKSAEDEGILVKADTIEGLAKAMGADVATFVETVNTWNGYFEAEEPKDLMYGRNLATAFPVAEGPFYAVKQTSKLLCTGSGLIIDEYSRVLDKNEEVIEGLYAAGNTSGGIFVDVYPRHLPATSIGRCATTGYVAAKHAILGE